MREGKRQRDAFEIYFRLGDDRSLERLHEVLQHLMDDRAPRERTLEEWSRRLSWQEQIIDIERQAREAQREVLVEEHEARIERKRKSARFMLQRNLELLRDFPPERATLPGINRGIETERRLRRRRQFSRST